MTTQHYHKKPAQIPEILKWQEIRFEKGTRYYRLILYQDLFHHWIITKVNGGIGTSIGKVRHELSDDYQASKKRFEDLCHYRQHKRQYVPIN